MFQKEIDSLRQQFEENANEGDARAMSDYMRGKFTFYGIKSPLRTKLSKSFLQQVRNPDKSAPREVLFQLWALPQREFQLTAVDLIRKCDKKAPKEYIDVYEQLIQDKSWWDTVDMIAGNSVGIHFRKYPELLLPSTEKWMNSGNMWLQRSALLFQLKFKEETDFELLTTYITIVRSVFGKS